MLSIYQRALGSDFEKLHPQMQRRFSLTSESGVASIGTGVMEKVWRGGAHTLPLLSLGIWRAVLYPENARDVHFNVQNYAFRDQLGRETVTWVRKFASTRVRRFDGYMIYSERRGCLVHYLGSHQNLAADLEVSVTDTGGLRFRSGRQRVQQGAVRAPWPLLVSGRAEVVEWFDEQQECFRVVMSARNPLWGRLFGYEGRFQASWEQIPPNYVPDSIRPRQLARD